MFASTAYVPGLNSRANRWVPNWLTFWVLKTLSSVLWMLEFPWLGSKMETFGPKLGVFEPLVQPVPALFTVQLNVAEPDAPVVSVAVTVTLPLVAVVGVPEISPVEELMDRPAGSPVAPYVSVCPDAESLARICRLTAVPTVEVWLPGLVTVTVFPEPEPVRAKTWNSNSE